MGSLIDMRRQLEVRFPPSRLNRNRKWQQQWVNIHSDDTAVYLLCSRDPEGKKSPRAIELSDSSCLHDCSRPHKDRDGVFAVIDSEAEELTYFSTGSSDAKESWIRKIKSQLAMIGRSNDKDHNFSQEHYRIGRFIVMPRGDEQQLQACRRRTASIGRFAVTRLPHDLSFIEEEQLQETTTSIEEDNHATERSYHSVLNSARHYFQSPQSRHPVESSYHSKNGLSAEQSLHSSHSQQTARSHHSGTNLHLLQVAQTLANQHNHHRQRSCVDIYATVSYGFGLSAMLHGGWTRPATEEHESEAQHNTGIADNDMESIWNLPDAMRSEDSTDNESTASEEQPDHESQRIDPAMNVESSSLQETQTGQSTAMNTASSTPEEVQAGQATGVIMDIESNDDQSTGESPDPQPTADNQQNVASETLSVIVVHDTDGNQYITSDEWIDIDCENSSHDLHYVLN